MNIDGKPIALSYLVPPMTESCFGRGIAPLQWDSVEQNDLLDNREMVPEEIALSAFIGPRYWTKAGQSLVTAGRFHTVHAPDFSRVWCKGGFTPLGEQEALWFEQNQAKIPAYWRRMPDEMPDSLFKANQNWFTAYFRNGPQGIFDSDNVLEAYRRDCAGKPVTVCFPGTVIKASGTVLHHTGGGTPIERESIACLSLDETTGVWLVKRSPVRNDLGRTLTMPRCFAAVYKR